jgi:hypothetical protein
MSMSADVARLVAVWAMLASYTLAIALAVAQVCADRPHTHGGAPAADCPMHHHGATQSQRAAHGGHHQHGVSAHGQPLGGAQMSCSCGSDVAPFFAGELATATPDAASSPLLDHHPVQLLDHARTTGARFSPPSPPPR